MKAGLSRRARGRPRGEEHGRLLAAAPPALEAALAQAPSGKPLDAQSRDHFEGRLGEDLADVRIHDGARAAALSQALGARAFTVGREIYFAEGEHRPGATEGRRLLAHELAHVGQQGGGDDPVVRRKLPSPAPAVKGPGPIAVRPAATGPDLLLKVLHMIRIMCRNDQMRAVLERIEQDKIQIVGFETAYDSWEYPDGHVEEVPIPGLNGNTDVTASTIRLNEALSPEELAMTLFHEAQHWQHYQDPKGPRGLESEIQARIATEQMAIDTGRPETRPGYRTKQGTVDEAAIRAAMAASPHYSPTGRKRVGRRYGGERPVPGPFTCPQLGDFNISPEFRHMG